MGWFSIFRIVEAGRTDKQFQICRILELGRSGTNALRPNPGAELALSRSFVLRWAMHPLAILAVGPYGELLPNQNGAPLRLVVPWKYGFKSGKSIVKIRFVEKQPATAWMKVAPDEYGFYFNVNPDVPHKRWSQSHERRLGEFLKRKSPALQWLCR